MKTQRHRGHRGRHPMSLMLQLAAERTMGLLRERR